MTFHQLTYVAEIARCGSISKAAQKLFLSQSGISGAVKELEEELGIALFSRSNRGVALTRAGREFLGYASALLERKEYIEGLYKGGVPGAPAYFSVSTQRYHFTEDAFIRLLERTAHPRFHFTIKATGIGAVIDDVYDHRADLGVIFLSGTTRRMVLHLLGAKDIEFHEIKAIAPCVFVRPGHPLAAKETVSPADLEGYAYLSFEHDQGMSMELSEEFHLLSFRKPARVISVNDRATAVNIIAGTDAITTGSGLLVEGLMDERMISIPLESEDRMRLGWIKARSHRLSYEAREFTALLEQSIADAVVYTEQVRKKMTKMGRVNDDKQ